MSYGLVFGGGTDHRVVCGSAAALDDLPSLSGFVWCRPTALSGGKGMFAKGQNSAAASWVFFSRSGADAPQTSLFRDHLTTNIEYRANNTPAPLVIDSWGCQAFTINETGLVGKIYFGSLSSAMAEISTYALSQAGSGAIVSDAAFPVIIGNRGDVTPTQSFEGTIAIVALFDRVLTLAEIEQLRTRPGRILSGCLGFWVLGNDGSTGTQVDRTGNGNDGTVTGCTASAQQLPIALFGALVNGGANTRSLVGRGLAA